MTQDATAAMAPLPAEAMLPRVFRVIGRHRETRDTVTLEIRPEDGEEVRFTPGQFTMVYVFGVGEVPLSISGGDAETLIHTVRSVGAVTDAICSLEEGDRVGVRGPYGEGWPALPEARDVVIVAGGIGLAPLRAVVLDVLGDRGRFGSTSLLYGTRSPADLLYEAELHEWRSRFDIEVEVTVDRSEPGWYGDVGMVTTLLPRIAFDPALTVAMVCGPEIMMKVVARELASRGVDTTNIYVSLERNMKCAIGFCGHCQYGPDFVCRDGPVVTYERVRKRMRVAQL